jgi:hypothetical protein
VAERGFYKIGMRRSKTLYSGAATDFHTTG